MHALQRGRLISASWLMALAAVACTRQDGSSEQAGAFGDGFLEEIDHESGRS